MTQEIDDEVMQVRIGGGKIDVWQGTAVNPTAIFQTDIATYLGLLQRQIQPDEAIAQGLVHVGGDPAALNRFLDLCGLPVA